MDSKNKFYRSHKGKSYTKALPTLFRNITELKQVLDLVTNELKKAQEGGVDASPLLVVDSDGFCEIKDVVSFLKKTSFDYINSTHIIELFFKDTDRKILINGDDRVKYKFVKYVKPPEKLFFGTLTTLKGRMIESGIRSKTKGYIKLYESEERALSFASKFAIDSNDIVVALAVDTDKAFSEGLKFSTYVDGEFIVVQVDKKYIINTGEK